MTTQGKITVDCAGSVRAARNNQNTAKELAQCFNGMTEATAQHLLDSKLEMDRYGGILPAKDSMVFLFEYTQQADNPVREHLGFPNWGTAIQHTVLLEANGCKHITLTNRDLTFDCDSNQVLDALAPPSSSRVG